MSNTIPSLLLVGIKQENLDVKEKCASRLHPQHISESSESDCVGNGHEWKSPPSPTSSMLSKDGQTPLIIPSVPFSVPAEQVNKKNNTSPSVSMSATEVGIAPNTSEIKYPKCEPEDPSCIKRAADLEGEYCPSPLSLTNVRTHKCKFCGDSFALSGLLKRHVNFVHKDLVCEVCGKGFKHKNEVPRHIDAVHKKLRPFACEMCGETFARKSYIKCHIDLVHKDQRAFTCEVCGESFKNKRDLNEHIDAVHRGLRTFVCKVCGETSTNRSTMNHHMKVVHKNQRAFECEICSKDFNTYRDLKEHIDAIHRGLRAFVCKVCGEAFAWRTAMYRHTSAIHKKSTQ